MHKPLARKLWGSNKISSCLQFILCVSLYRNAINSICSIIESCSCVFEYKLVHICICSHVFMCPYVEITERITQLRISASHCATFHLYLLVHPYSCTRNRRMIWIHDRYDVTSGRRAFVTTVLPKPITPV